MSQTIIIGYPPLFDEIQAAFPRAVDDGTIFSWGDRIYSPFGGVIPQYVLDHEAVHGRRQGATLVSIMDWWRRYIDDVSFRLSEEYPAHVAEYRWWLEHGNRKQRRRALDRTAQRLANPLYGRMVGLSAARDMLRQGIRRAA